MRILSFMLLTLIVVGSSCAAFESNDCLESDFDYGMNNFKFTNEWIIEKDGQALIRVGVNAESFNPKMPKEIKAFDKMVKPVDDSIIALESMHKSSQKDEILVFDIPVAENTLKLNLAVTTKLTKGDFKCPECIKVKFKLLQNVYFYNPKKEQWFGFTNAYNHVNKASQIVGKSSFINTPLSKIYETQMYEKQFCTWDFPIIVRKSYEDFIAIQQGEDYDEYLAKLDELSEEDKKSNIKPPLLWWKNTDSK